MSKSDARPPGPGPKRRRTASEALRAWADEWPIKARPFVSPSPQSFGCCPGAVSLIPDSPRPAFIAGHGFMPDACGARNGYQPWQCGLEQPRSQLTGPMSKLASRANVYVSKALIKSGYPCLRIGDQFRDASEIVDVATCVPLLGTQKETQL